MSRRGPLGERMISRGILYHGVRNLQEKFGSSKHVFNRNYERIASNSINVTFLEPKTYHDDTKHTTKESETTHLKRCPLPSQRECANSFPVCRTEVQQLWPLRLCRECRS